MTIRQKIKILRETNWLKTIRVNFYYFPFGVAIKLPIFIAYRTVLQTVMGGVKIDGTASPGMMLFGYKSLGSIDSFYERSIWSVSGNIVLKGKDISIGRGSKLCVSGLCSIDKRFMITGRSSIICRSNISFGQNVLLSWDILIMDTDYHSVLDEHGRIINPDCSIIIGDDVWIGCRSTVLKGSNIPSNAVIAACSVISGKMDKERCIYSSNNRILKENISWKR